jgi:hypothetical protein
MKETGISEEAVKNQSMAKVFGFALLASLVIAFNLAIFLGESSTLEAGIS